MVFFKFYLSFILVVLAEICSGRIRDPYGILRVSRDASTPDIKRAYKQLVKEW